MEVKCVPFKITVEGQEVEAFLTEKNWELVLEAINKNKKKTGYEQVKSNNDYYTVSANDIVETNMFCGGFGTSCYDVANYYSDRTVAENNARADKLMRQLRRFAVEHREYEMNWNDLQSIKYHIYYDNSTSKLLVDYSYADRVFGAIHFRSRENAELAIEKFHDELIWYFTEYKDSL